MAYEPRLLRHISRFYWGVGVVFNLFGKGGLARSPNSTQTPATSPAPSPQRGGGELLKISGVGLSKAGGGEGGGGGGGVCAPFR